MDIREISGRTALGLDDVGRWVITLSSGTRFVVLGYYADALNFAASR